MANSLHNNFVKRSIKYELRSLESDTDEKRASLHSFYFYF